MSLIVLDVLSHKSHVFVVGPSSGERYATWVVDVETRISGNTTRSSYAHWDAKNLANIDELPCLVMYEKMCALMLMFLKKIFLKTNCGFSM